MERGMAERLITDVGGFEAGEVPREERPPLFWERQLIAVLNVLRQQRVLNLDEFRRKVEELRPQDYARLGFYVRRLEAIAGLLVEKGVLTADEIEARTQHILRQGTRDHVERV
jgi:nitrile hydratase